jgi:hypothetical protein
LQDQPQVDVEEKPQQYTGFPIPILVSPSPAEVVVPSGLNKDLENFMLEVLSENCSSEEFDVEEKPQQYTGFPIPILVSPSPADVVVPSWLNNDLENFMLEVLSQNCSSEEFESHLLEEKKMFPFPRKNRVDEKNSINNNNKVIYNNNSNNNNNENKKYRKTKKTRKTTREMLLMLMLLLLMTLVLMLVLMMLMMMKLLLFPSRSSNQEGQDQFQWCTTN